MKSSHDRYEHGAGDPRRGPAIGRGKSADVNVSGRGVNPLAISGAKISRNSQKLSRLGQQFALRLKFKGIVANELVCVLRRGEVRRSQSLRATFAFQLFARPGPAAHPAAFSCAAAAFLRRPAPSRGRARAGDRSSCVPSGGPTFRISSSACPDRGCGR